MVLAAAGIVGAGTLVWLLGYRAPPVTRPSDPQRLTSELAALIEKHVAAAKKSPRDAKLRATLGLVYEAHEMWPETLECYRIATVLNPNEPMWPHHAGIAWMETGDLAGATTWLRRHAERFPSFAPIQDRLGALLLEAGQMEEARMAFETVIKHAPRSPAGHVGLGDIRLRQGDHEGAIRSLDTAVRLDPSYKLARYLLGRAYRAAGRLEEAERELRLGMVGGRLYIEDSWSRRVSEFEVGIGAMQERSVELMRAGRPAEAAEVLEGVMAQQPANAEAAVNLGIAYLETNRLDEAEQMLLKAMGLEPTRFEVYINLAACSLRRNRLPNALQYIDRAIELSPTSAQAHLTRGLILMRQHENDLALQALTTAAGLDAANPKIVQELANVCSRLGRHDEAVGYFRTLSKLLPTRWEPHFGAARALYAQGRLDEALAAAHRGLELSPQEPRLLALAQQISGAGLP